VQRTKEQHHTKGEHMATRSIASLTISFGLVAIPVKLYSATQASAAISFNMLHAKDGSRLRQQYICVKEDVPVPREEIVRGYEFAKDQYVVFSPDELKALEETATHTVDIGEFVPLNAVDPVYFDKAYYLAPDKGGAKPYALLTRALEDSGLCAIGRWAARGKQYIVMLRPVRNGLVMQQLLYADEVRSIDELEVPKADVKAGELQLARQLIQQSAAERFDPSGYKDEVKARIQAAIDQKVSGQQITVAEAPREGGAQIIDLMDALRASLEKSPRAKPAAAEADEAVPSAPRARKPARKAPQETPAEAAPKRAARRK
jgi:DNA end-binding protein Ku